MAPIGSKAVSKRKSLTVVDKLKVIELGSKSISQRKMAYELNISKSQVQQILKQKECIQQRVNSYSEIKCSKPSEFVEIS